MSDQSANNKRIAKNTIFLYIRMLITMAIGLFTSRIVLRTLGVEDYGIYNIVGGVVVLFNFVNQLLIFLFFTKFTEKSTHQSTAFFLQNSIG